MLKDKVSLDRDLITSTIFYCESSNWEEIQYPASSIILKPGAAIRDATDNCIVFPHLGSPGALNGLLQIPHGHKLNSAVIPHIHWQATDIRLGNVCWELSFKIGAIGGNFSADWKSEEILLAPTRGILARHFISVFESINMSRFKLGTLLKWKLQRLNTDTRDTYANGAKLLAVDFLYQKDSVGSGRPMTK